MTVERFNKEAAGWDANPYMHLCSKLAYDAIRKHVAELNDEPTSVHALDIGCGTGVLSLMMAPHVKSLTAVDTSSGMIDMLNKKLKDRTDIQNVFPVCALLEDPEDPVLRVPGGSDKPPRFNLITCHLTLHHIPALPPFFKLLHALLAPGGQIALTDYEDFGPDAIKFHPAFKRADVERHGLKRGEMEQAIREAGFADVNVTRAFSTARTVEQGETIDFPFLLCLGKRSS